MTEREASLEDLAGSTPKIEEKLEKYAVARIPPVDHGDLSHLPRSYLGCITGFICAAMLVTSPIWLTGMAYEKIRNYRERRRKNNILDL